MALLRTIGVSIALASSAFAAEQATVLVVDVGPFRLVAHPGV